MYVTGTICIKNKRTHASGAERDRATPNPRNTHTADGMLVVTSAYWGYSSCVNRTPDGSAGRGRKAGEAGEAGSIPAPNANEEDRSRSNRWGEGTTGYGEAINVERRLRVSSDAMLRTCNANGRK